jgi:carboxyl-terminal processing protease
VKSGIVSIVTIALLSACTLPGVQRSEPTAAIPIDLPLTTQAQLRDFDLAVKAVRDQYIDPKAVGNNWQPTITSYRDRVAKGMDDNKFFDTLSELLATLNDEDLALGRPTTQTQTDSSIPISATFAGIGVMASLPGPNQDRILVMGVYPDSPAEHAGIKAHDAIVKIDGTTVTYADRDNLLSRIRGRSGTLVTLSIRTPGQAVRDVSLTRRAIIPTSLMVSKSLPNSNIGYIKPDPSDSHGMRLAVTQALRDLSSEQTLDGLVLDLRTTQNPDFPISDMLGLFVNAQVGTLYTRTGKTKLEITGKNIAGSQELPLIVLVSDQTRGVAESFAGILQDLGRARIAGRQTPGRLALQMPLTMPNTGAVLLIPSGEYRGVKDKSWYRVGIKPDITSDLNWEQYTDDSDPQLQQAVQALAR